jgi:Protein of unknown function (DUF3987)/DnaB-like helicase N terminal domain
MSATATAGIPIQEYPHDLSAEHAVLGACLLEDGRAAFDRVRARLVPGDFFEDAHGLLFETMLAIPDDQPIDTIIVAAAVRRDGHTTLAGTPVAAKLAALMEAACIAAHLDQYADIVAEMAARRGLLALGQRLRHSLLGGAESADVVWALRDEMTRIERKAGEGWPEPQPVQRGLPAVPAFDSRLLPPPLADWIMDIAERMQCPLEFVAVAAIVDAAAVVGRKVGIRPKREDTWTVVPNLWGAVIGPPSVLKTPAMQEAMRPLRQLVAGAREAHKTAAAEHRVTATERKIRLEALEDKLRSAIKKDEPDAVVELIRKDLAAAVPTEPPAERRYITNDTTIEKLGELLNQNPNGLLVFRDELTGFLAAMDRQGHEGNRAFYLEAWAGDGAEFTYDRISRGTLHIKSPCVSLLGSIQPGPLAAYLREAFGGEKDDGFVQRFQLAVYPDPEPAQQRRRRQIHAFGFREVFLARVARTKVAPGALGALTGIRRLRLGIDKSTEQVLAHQALIRLARRWPRWL